MRASARLALVIPALNEEQALAATLAEVPRYVDRVVVADNGSTDRTAEVARMQGAQVVHESRRGYGSACLAALSALQDDPPHVVIFMDADHSDVPAQMDRLIDPIRIGEADLVIGSRVRGHHEPGSLTPPQRFGNALATRLLRLAFGARYTDLGPFRAISWPALRTLEMDDTNFGWTVQMQARAAALGLLGYEVPVDYRPRIGKSKISGTARGVVLAGEKILRTIYTEWRRAKTLLNPAESATRLVGPVPESGRELVLFTKLPTPGTTKTRMIPALGEQGAADLQRDMTRHLLREMQRLEPVVAYASSSGAPNASQVEQGQPGNVNPHAAMTKLFGPQRYTPQGEGDLGDRLTRAMRTAFERRASSVCFIGGDCPTLTEGYITDAFDKLTDHDAVLGPATDGGYVLLAMRRPCPELFQGIDWGGPEVFAQTQARAESHGITLAVLDAQPDIDRPDDLPVWDAVRDKVGDGSTQD